MSTVGRGVSAFVIAAIGAVASGGQVGETCSFAPGLWYHDAGCRNMWMNGGAWVRTWATYPGCSEDCGQGEALTMAHGHASGWGSWTCVSSLGAGGACPGAFNSGYDGCAAEAGPDNEFDARILCGESPAGPIFIQSWAGAEAAVDDIYYFARAQGGGLSEADVWYSEVGETRLSASAWMEVPYGHDEYLIYGYEALGKVDSTLSGLGSGEASAQASEERSFSSPCNTLTWHVEGSLEMAFFDQCALDPYPGCPEYCQSGYCAGDCSRVIKVTFVDSTVTSFTFDGLRSETTVRQQALCGCVGDACTNGSLTCLGFLEGNSAVANSNGWTADLTFDLVVPAPEDATAGVVETTVDTFAKFGDLDRDGDVDCADRELIVDLAAAEPAINDPAYAARADFDLSGVIDASDLAAFDAEFEPPADCNSNGVPDACEIAAGTAADCNTNAIPDECDIARGTSEDDFNTNGVPDECESPVFVSIHTIGKHGGITPDLGIAVDPSSGIENIEPRKQQVQGLPQTYVRVEFDKVMDVDSNAVELTTNGFAADPTAIADLTSNGSRFVAITFDQAFHDEKCYQFELHGLHAADGSVFGSGGEDTTFCLCYHEADVNRSGTVGATDGNLVTSIANWGKAADEAGAGPGVDIDRSGIVGPGDGNLVTSIANWAHSLSNECP